MPINFGPVSKLIQFIPKSRPRGTSGMIRTAPVSSSETMGLPLESILKFARVYLLHVSKTFADGDRREDFVFWYFVLLPSQHLTISYKSSHQQSGSGRTVTELWWILVNFGEFKNTKNRKTEMRAALLRRLVQGSRSGFYACVTHCILHSTVQQQAS